MALPVQQRATTQFFYYPKLRLCPLWRSVCVSAGVVAMLGACTTPDPNERVTGSGGTAVKYSSRQVSVDLTDSERNALAAMRDRSFPGSTREQALTAVAAALKSSGYAPVTVETDTALVEAGRAEVLVPKWREVLRGVLKTRIGMLPAKPDHHSLESDMHSIGTHQAAAGSVTSRVRAATQTPDRSPSRRRSP
ncbi:hypothetical protein SAMN05446635_8610 [Burkholderia sp. OK233]|nr:hypothetical protein SAMN05446635_8610 [Burkholderia sp. OK233]